MFNLHCPNCGKENCRWVRQTKENTDPDYPTYECDTCGLITKDEDLNKFD